MAKARINEITVNSFGVSNVIVEIEWLVDDVWKDDHDHKFGSVAEATTWLQASGHEILPAY